MKKANLNQTEKLPIIEILNNYSASKIQLKGYKKILIPYNNSFSFCIFTPEEERNDTLPFYIEDIIHNIPIKIIILNSELRLVSTNIPEKGFLKTVYEKIKSSAKEHLEKLYLFETVHSDFSYKQNNYRLTINALIKYTNNPGYICTIEETIPEKKEPVEKVNTIIQDMLSAENLKKLKEISKKIPSIFKIETLSFFKKEKTGLKLVFSSCGISDIKVTLPSTIEKEVENENVAIMSGKLCPLKGLETKLKKFVFVYQPELPEMSRFIVIGSSDFPINKYQIKKYNWLFKIFCLTYTQLEKRNKIGNNIFDNYYLPIILVNKQTMRIKYANKSFKKYFGEKTPFFNALLSPQSNIKILRKLDTEIAPFSDYLEASTGDNFSTIVKATVIPEIISTNSTLFAVIFKTQQHEINIKLNLKPTQTPKELDIEIILSLVQKYLSIVINTKNIEKSINFILKDISCHLNAIGSFLAKIDNNANEITLINFFTNEKSFNFQQELIDLEKENLLSNLSANKIHQFKIEQKNLTIFALKLKPERNNEYIWGLIFENNKCIGLSTKIALPAFKNIFIIALRKKEKETIYIEVEKEKEKLEKINKEIITTISHEIKTPLTSILGLCEVISGKLKKEDKKLATSIKENALNLLELLEAMLEINKIEEKGIEVIKKRNVNTNEFIKSIESFVQGINKNPNVKFRIITRNLPPFFHHDATIIYRVTVNLLDNAFRYTKRGVVTFSLTFENRNIIIEVKDTGTGISKNNLEKIFIPFFQEKTYKRNNKKNVGFGLYIVKRLCDIIDAEIDVKSEKNIGTYFKITIPLKENYEHNPYS